MVNKVIWVGTVGADPEIRYTLEGKPVAVFRVATNEVLVKNGNKEVITEWHRLVAFGKLAEICGEYLTKGTKVYIEGKLRTRKYEDKQGITRTVTEILVQNLQILDKKTESSSLQTQKNSFPIEESLELGETLSPLEEDDIPF